MRRQRVYTEDVHSEGRIRIGREENYRKRDIKQYIEKAIHMEGEKGMKKETHEQGA